jgi:hypothetical protein
MQSFGKFLASTTVSMLASGGAIAQTSYYEYGRRRQIRLLAGSRKAALSRNGTGSAMVIPAPGAAWVSAPILPTRKVPVIFLRRDGSVVACPNRYFDKF